MLISAIDNKYICSEFNWMLNFFARFLAQVFERNIATLSLRVILPNKHDDSWKTGWWNDLQFWTQITANNYSFINSSNIFTSKWRKHSIYLHVCIDNASACRSEFLTLTIFCWSGPIKLKNHPYDFETPMSKRNQLFISEFYASACAMPIATTRPFPSVFE
jgi:hypothetical protein